MTKTTIARLLSILTGTEVGEDKSKKQLEMELEAKITNMENQEGEIMNFDLQLSLPINPEEEETVIAKAVPTRPRTKLDNFLAFIGWSPRYVLTQETLQHTHYTRYQMKNGKIVRKGGEPSNEVGIWIDNDYYHENRPRMNRFLASIRDAAIDAGHRAEFRSDHLHIWLHVK